MTIPHKRFISSLVRRRHGVSLPLELDLRIGMRKYQILITRDSGDFPQFRCELGRYVLPRLGVTGVIDVSTARCCTHEVLTVEEGKKPILDSSSKSLDGKKGKVISHVDRGDCDFPVRITGAMESGRQRAVKILSLSHMHQKS